jgi:hypothetical protein
MVIAVSQIGDYVRNKTQLKVPASAQRINPLRLSYPRECSGMERPLRRSASHTSHILGETVDLAGALLEY